MQSTRLPRSRLVLVSIVAGLAAVGAPRPAPVATLSPTETVEAATSACPRGFPATNVWNKRVDALPVRSDSKTLLTTMGLTKTLHPDFGSYMGYGIPYNVVSSATPRSTVTFTWPTESDKVGYPIP